jgi:hypothetical protein
MALQIKQLKEVRQMEYLYNTKRDTAQQRKYYLG